MSSSSAWPPRLAPYLVPDEPDQVLRLARFRQEHPDVIIGPSAAEEPLGELRVRACVAQAGRLLAWAATWPQWTWAVEGAGGTGHLLDWQLLSAGERVLDVWPKLGARVRLLVAGDVNKNDPGDARRRAALSRRARSPAR